MSPQQSLIFGFGFYTLLGWIFLCLPFLHKQAVPALDNLFTVTSAISTTGLVTVSISDSYTWMGQLIILLLIQFGGVGYMTFSSFIILSRHHQITHQHQKILIAEFPMPKEFKLNDFLKSAILFTLITETIGAICLFIAFKNTGVETCFAIWSSIFHSVSAFCTCGMGLYNNSFESFAGNVSLNIIISVLSILGALGFIVATDIWYRFSGKSKATTFTTKVILLVTTIFLLFGTLTFYFNEPSIAKATTLDKILASFFQSMAAMSTVGFNTIPIGKLSLSMLLLATLLMYIGASPSGTGGGLKTTTLTAIIAILWSGFRRNDRVTFFGRMIPAERLHIATLTFIFYTGTIFFMTYLLSFTENFSLINILFETVSAIGTVGLSMGITGDLTSLGKIIIIITMFIGRLGALTLGLSIFAKRPNSAIHSKMEDLAV